MKLGSRKFGLLLLTIFVIGSAGTVAGLTSTGREATTAVTTKSCSGTASSCTTRATTAVKKQPLTAPVVSFAKSSPAKCVTAPCPETVALQWTASPTADEISQYVLYINNEVYATFDSSQLSFRHLAQGTNTTYTYMVQAVGRLGSVDSNTLIHTTRPPADQIAPTAPSNLTFQEVTVGDYAGIRLNWTAATDNIGVTRYEVIRRDNNSGAVEGFTVPANQTTFTDLVSKVNTGAAFSYSYLVVAFDEAGNISAPSTEVDFPIRAILDPPRLITVKGRSSVQLNWKTPVIDRTVDHFVVTRWSDSIANDYAEYVIPGTQTSFENTLPSAVAAAVTTYYYTVIAVATDGYQLYGSNMVSVVRGAEDSPNTAPNYMQLPDMIRKRTF